MALRKAIPAMVLCLAVAATLVIGGCSSGSDGGGVLIAGSSAVPYPTAKDALEGAAGNDTSATATQISVGYSRQLTIFPQRDKDWFQVDLTAGTEYEFSANKICATCDTYLSLYDTDGVTVLAWNDDYVGYDSALQYTPGLTGTYYVMVRAFDATYGVDTYTLGVRTFVDTDGDGYSTYHDCDDNDNTIYPWATEIPGDGIDQDCSGTDEPLDTNADNAENDDEPATARSMAMSGGYLWEIIYRSDIYRPNTRTIEAVDEVDFMKVSVPAHSAIEVDLAMATDCMTSGLFDSDGVTLLDEIADTCVQSDWWIDNVTGSAKTYYIGYAASDWTSTRTYVPGWYSLGVDNDGDGYYTKDWGSSRDCDDSDAAIHFGAAEITLDDGIDSNCNGDDNS